MGTVSGAFLLKSVNSIGRVSYKASPTLAAKKCYQIGIRFKLSLPLPQQGKPPLRSNLWSSKYCICIDYAGPEPGAMLIHATRLPNCLLHFQVILNLQDYHKLSSQPRQVPTWENAVGTRRRLSSLMGPRRPKVHSHRPF